MTISGVSFFESISDDTQRNRIKLLTEKTGGMSGILKYVFAVPNLKWDDTHLDSFRVRKQR